jgi:hypothetical protein
MHCCAAYVDWFIFLTPIAGTQINNHIALNNATFVVHTEFTKLESAKWYLAVYASAPTTEQFLISYSITSMQRIALSLLNQALSYIVCVCCAHTHTHTHTHTGEPYEFWDPAMIAMISFGSATIVVGIVLLVLIIIYKRKQSRNYASIF